MADDLHVETGLSRELTLFHITMMGVGMMIGAGVFIGTGASIKLSGPGGVLLTFGFNGVIALITAMGYAELASAMPRAGGAYHYTRIGFGKGVSFLAGWMEWFASSVAGSLYAVTFATYVLHFFQQVGWVTADLGPVAHWVCLKSIAVAIGLLFVYINFRGVAETGKTGAFITLGQTATLAFVAVVGYVVVHREPERLANFQPFIHPAGWHQLIFTMGAAYVAFEGFEVIAQTGDEAIDARRNLPKAMLYSILIVVTTYVCVAAAVVVSVRPDGLEGGQQVWQWLGAQGENGSLAFAEGVKRLLPVAGLGKLLCVLAVIFSSTSALNATVYSATRVSYALGRDGMLPSAFSNIHPTRKVPHVALIATSVIVLIVAVALPVSGVAASASAMFLLLFLIVNLCVIKVRRQLGDELTYGFVMPLFPILPILAIILQICMAIGLAHLSMVAWISCGIWLTLCLIVYHTYSRHHAQEPKESIVTFEEDVPPETKPRSILLPLANPANALVLIKPTVTLAKGRDAQVDLLHMVPIPAQAPLADAPKYMAEGEEAIVEALLYMSMNCTVTRTIQYCRNVARGVLSAARQRNTNMVIMGWRGRSYRREFVMGSTVDPVLERAPCDVVLIKDWPKGKIGSVLVPVAGGPHTTLALEVAARFALEDEGTVTPFHVVRPDRSREDAERFVQSSLSALDFPRDLFKPKYVDSATVIEAILEEVSEHDLVVIGTSQERIWQQLVAGSLPEEIARQCDKPVAMVKARTVLKSWVSKWI